MTVRSLLAECDLCLLEQFAELLSKENGIFYFVGTFDKVVNIEMVNNGSGSFRK